MFMKKSSLFLSLALLLAGCSSSKNMVYMSNDSYRIDEIAPTLKKDVHTLWFGLAQETNIYPNEVCKEYGYNEAIAVVLGIKACGSANLKMAYRRAVNSTDPAGKRPSGVS